MRFTIYIKGVSDHELPYRVLTKRLKLKYTQVLFNDGIGFKAIKS